MSLFNHMEGEGSKKRLPQERLNFIDSMVSSYCSVLNSTESLGLIRQANEVSAVTADLELDRQEKKKSKGGRRQKNQQG